MNFGERESRVSPIAVGSKKKRWLGTRGELKKSESGERVKLGFARRAKLIEGGGREKQEAAPMVGWGRLFGGGGGGPNGNGAELRLKEKNYF